MSLAITRLFDNVRIHTPGVADTALKLELFNVLNEFFSDSKIWQEEITFRVKAGTSEYSIENESVASIDSLIWVKTSTDLPVVAAMTIPGELELRTAPSQDDTYTANVALTVDDPVTRDGYPEFPEWVLTKYMDGILDGLVGRLMAQPAKPYSNATLATFRLRKFRVATAKAKGEGLHRNVNNGQTWRFPQSFASRRR